MGIENAIKEINEHIKVANLVLELAPVIEDASEMVISTIKSSNRIYLFGNGGSAADAQHIAAEFTGRYVKERKGLPAIALTTDTSAITAISNDYGFDYIFERQIQALAHKGDLLIGISTSGNSANVIKALKYGQTIGCKTLALTGLGGGSAANYCDINIAINSKVTARVQEMHILIGHIICKAIDTSF